MRALVAERLAAFTAPPVAVMDATPGLMAPVDAAPAPEPAVTLQASPETPCVARNGHAIVRIDCLCGVQIAGMIPTGRGDVFGYLPTYQEAELRFDDGSKHITHGCRACLQNATEDTAERFYLRDLVQFDRLEVLGESYVMPAPMWELMGKRRIASLRLVTRGA